MIINLNDHGLEILKFVINFNFCQNLINNNKIEFIFQLITILWNIL